jgi:hypothetical protein
VALAGPPVLKDMTYGWSDDTYDGCTLRDDILFLLASNYFYLSLLVPFWALLLTSTVHEQAHLSNFGLAKIEHTVRDYT